MAAGVYLIKCEAEGPDRDRVYVGSSVHIRKRINHHKGRLRNNKHHVPDLQRAWNLYGSQAFTFETLEEVAPGDGIIERLNEREQFWIDEHEAYLSGYNQSPTAGSVAGVTRSAETRARIGASKRGRIVSAITRQRTADSVREIMKDQAARDRIAATLTGYKHTDEARANMTAALTKRMNTPEAKAFISRLHKGRKKPAGFGAKIGDANRRRVYTPEKCARMAEIARDAWAKRKAEVVAA